MSTKEPLVMITCRIPVSQVERLDEVAERLGVGRSVVMRDALAAGLRDTAQLADMWEAKPVREFVELLRSRSLDEERAQLQLDQVVKWMRSEERKKQGKTPAKRDKGKQGG